tara:strand:- start:2172 stop:3458 length:1287 start_codon:yes stop_codon:yes gene_type:complete
MKLLNKTIKWLSNLKVAIFLLLIIALSSALGTVIPQNESIDNYIRLYGEKPFLGLINGETILRLQLNHIYSSIWFLSLLGWLTFALIICSWRRQLPMIKTALRWVDYKSPNQIRKLALSKTIEVKDSKETLNKFAEELNKNGWNIKQKTGRIAARKGALGRIGPPFVHLGLILLILGATVGNLNGQKTERFLAPGRSIDLLSTSGQNQLNLKLIDFYINRNPAGQPEQFTSTLELNRPNETKTISEISVNHPLRTKGLTIYQADWSLAALTIKAGKSPKLQLPLKRLSQLGDEIWGLAIPTKEENSNPILLTVSNERGPVKVFDENGNFLETLRIGAQHKVIYGTDISVINVIPASGLLLKHDPGVPIVYAGFGMTLIGAFISILSTKQLWIVAEPEKELLHIGGLSNRNLTGFANELPKILTLISSN